MSERHHVRALRCLAEFQLLSCEGARATVARPNAIGIDVCRPSCSLSGILVGTLRDGVRSCGYSWPVLVVRIVRQA
eukprot:6310392-Alexandrium_andersonii.AAC.1